MSEKDRLLVCSLTVLFVVSFAISPLGAQGTAPASIIGQVRDDTGAVLPGVTMNVRRIMVDQAEKPAVWIGENHHGRILKVEPLD